MKPDAPILILAPHIDDGEFGCGGSISKYIEMGAEVYYAVFTMQNDNTAGDAKTKSMEHEFITATHQLGIKPDNLIMYEYPIRRLGEYRQDVLEHLISIRDRLKPQMVLTPSIYDIHQDHSTLTNEAMRAFKNVSLLGYEMPWNNYTFNTNCFIHLQERHIRKKIEALKCYESQSGRIYANHEYIDYLARTRGVQAGTEYAEAFNIIRWVIT